MSKIRRMVNEVSWMLGVICVAASIVLRLLPILETKSGVTAHGGLVLAAVLFLCVLATGEAGKAPSSS